MTTLTDKLLVVPTLGLVLGKTAIAAATGPFRGSEGAPTYLEHVVNTFTRSLLMHISVAQVQ